MSWASASDQRLWLDEEVEALVCVPADYIQAVDGLVVRCTWARRDMYFEESAHWQFSAAVWIEVEYRHLGLSACSCRRVGRDDSEEVAAALKAGFVLLCVGETLEELRRASGRRRSGGSGPSKVSCERFEEIVIAYEPIWAISAGKTASAGMLRRWLASV